MDLNEYQHEARKTHQTPSREGSQMTVSLFGLAGEVGELLSEYKKWMRDGDAHLLHRDRVAEELGDLLWYVANVADQFELALENIASQNLAKIDARWGGGRQLSRGPDSAFDDAFPAEQRLPRIGTAEIRSIPDTDPAQIEAWVNGAKMGQDLTDNAHVEDGYRFHDVFHLACMTLLGWSPVIRRGLSIKRKSDERIDEVEDGGRAIVIEEGVSALIFSYAINHNMLEGISSLDYDLLRTIKQMTVFFEVRVRTEADWERTILKAYDVWRAVAEHGHGRIAFNADTQEFDYLGPC